MRLVTLLATRDAVIETEVVKAVSSLSPGASWNDIRQAVQEGVREGARAWETEVLNDVLGEGAAARVRHAIDTAEIG